MKHGWEGAGCNTRSGGIVFEFDGGTSLGAGGSFQVPSAGNIADTITVDKDLVSGAYTLGTVGGRGAVAGAAGGVTKQFFDQYILDTPGIVGCTGGDF